MKLRTFFRYMKRLAKTTAEERGHLLTTFVTQSDLTTGYELWGRAKCRQCGMPAAVYTGERPYLRGAVFDLPCARPEVEIPLQDAIAALVNDRHPLGPTE